MYFSMCSVKMHVHVMIMYMYVVHKQSMNHISLKKGLDVNQNTQDT